MLLYMEILEKLRVMRHDFNDMNLLPMIPIENQYEICKVIVDYSQDLNRCHVSISFAFNTTYE